MSIDSLGLNREILRLSGLTSGLETDTIVNSLLKIDQYKVDKQFQTKTKLEWKRDAFRDINLMLRNFREDYMSVLKPENNMLSKTGYNNYEVTMLTETDAVAIEAGYSANAGTLTINSITQLAEAAKAESLNIFNTDTISMDTALKDLDLVTPLTFQDNEMSFSINGETFTFSDEATLSEVISTINSNSNAGVTMTYSSLKKGFKIVADETGAASTVDIVNIKGNAFDAVSSAFGIAEDTYTGQDAILEIENISVTRSTNSFTIDGISYTLRDKPAGAITFNVERDVDATMEKITNFIDAYNELLGKLQDKLDEPVYRTYNPLTDEERDALSESQAEKWDEMAKSGMLRNDSNLSGLVNKLRNSFYTVIEGLGKSAADIGLRTGSYKSKGQIFIDEEVLRQAVENNPQEVENIFIQMSDSTDPTTKYNESGLISRISDMFLDYTKNATYNTIANAESAVNRAEDRLEKLMDTMERNEERYWARFTAMETALARMNSQSSYLLSMLGGSSQE